MVAILDCAECGHYAVYEQEDNLWKCPECDDIHVDVTYGVAYEISAWGPGKYKLATNEDKP